MLGLVEILGEVVNEVDADVGVVGFELLNSEALALELLHLLLLALLLELCGGVEARVVALQLLKQELADGGEAELAYLGEVGHDLVAGHQGENLVNSQDRESPAVLADKNFRLREPLPEEQGWVLEVQSMRVQVDDAVDVVHEIGDQLAVGG